MMAAFAQDRDTVDRRGRQGGRRGTAVGRVCRALGQTAGAQRREGAPGRASRRARPHSGRRERPDDRRARADAGTLHHRPHARTTICRSTASTSAAITPRSSRPCTPPCSRISTARTASTCARSAYAGACSTMATSCRSASTRSCTSTSACRARAYRWATREDDAVPMLRDAIHGDRDHASNASRRRRKTTSCRCGRITQDSGSVAASA